MKKTTAKLKTNKNQYLVGANLIHKSNLELKSIKSFQGRQGIGISANIYWNGIQCGTFLDEANGGEYYIDWDYAPLKDGKGQGGSKEANEAWEFLKSLPKFSDVEWKEGIGYKPESHDSSERDNGWKWYWCDVIINEWEKKQQYNKWLRKVVIFNEKTQNIDFYKAQAKCLKDIQYELAFKAIGGVILNNLPKSEAYEYFNKYVGVK